MDTIVLCGISTKIGVKSTARCTSYGFRQVFAEDAMFSMSAEQPTQRSASSSGGWAGTEDRGNTQTDRINI